MTRGFLIVNSGSRTERRAQVYDGLVLGRAEDCGLVLDDSAASRHHAEIKIDGDHFLVKDLASTNGTYVNGLLITTSALALGDLLTVGDTEFRFEIEERPDNPFSAFGEDTPTFLSAILDKTGNVVARPPAEKSNELLQAVYHVTNAIASIYDPCDLVDRILETTIRAIRAQRGAVFFRASESNGDELNPCPVCHRVHVIRDGQIARAGMDDIRISQTVARRVIKLGESVLYHDTDDDSELNAAESVMTLQIRSIICAPLRAKSGILGILYCDTDRANHNFSNEDMLLSTAVGNSAGLAIENAQMHRELLDKQRIEQEIEHAWKIQEGFLVNDWPEAPRFDVYGETRPAKTVGGDFYDFVQPDPDHVGILIGDVSGKGVPAALAMAQMLADFRQSVHGLRQPARVLRTLNEDLAARSQEGMFCTLCYILLDLKSGAAVGANAGHLPPLKLSSAGVDLLELDTGPPVGIIPGHEWRDLVFSLAPGDMLLLYTDGVSEARNARKEEFGVERLRQLGARIGSPNARDAVAAIRGAVEQHCAGASPHDDFTMLALRFKGG